MHCSFFNGRRAGEQDRGRLLWGIKFVGSIAIPVEIGTVRKSTRRTTLTWLYFETATHLLCVLLLVPVAAHAQSGSPFDTGFTNLQTLFTGTVAKVASLIAIFLQPICGISQPQQRRGAMQEQA
jgi:hypothetical protein